MDADTTVPDLVRRARNGRQDAWNALVDRYLALCLAVVRRSGLRGPDAEDVVQTVWLRLVEHLEEIREAEALPGWLATTARNECRRVLRTRRRTETFDPLEGAPDHADVAGDGADGGVAEWVVDAVSRWDRQQALLEAFAALPDHHRNLLRLLLVDPPLSYAQISSRLDIAVGSIGPTRARALERLRRHPAVARQIAAGRAAR